MLEREREEVGAMNEWSCGSREMWKGWNGKWNQICSNKFLSCRVKHNLHFIKWLFSLSHSASSFSSRLPRKNLVLGCRCVCSVFLLFPTTLSSVVWTGERRRDSKSEHERGRPLSPVAGSIPITLELRHFYETFHFTVNLFHVDWAWKLA